MSMAILASSLSLAGQQGKTRAQHNIPDTTRSASQSKDLGRDTTFDLLREAYATSRSLRSEQRIPLLAELAQIAASMNSRAGELRITYREATGTRGGGRSSGSKKNAPLAKKQRDEVSAWAEELFQLAEEFPSGSQPRSQAQVGAARAMVPIDPKRAMQMIDNIDPVQDRWDPRTSVFSTLFKELYATQGLRALSEIRRETLSLGDHGSYPYQAVAGLLDQVQDHPEVVRQFFADAVDYLRRNSANRSQLFGMIGLIGSKKLRAQLEPWQVSDAVAQLVSQVKEYARAQASGTTPDPSARSVLLATRSTLKNFAPEAAAQVPDPTTLSGGFLLSVNSDSRRKVPQPVSDESVKVLRTTFSAAQKTLMAMSEDQVHEGAEMRQAIDRAVDLGAALVERTVGTYAPEDHAYAMRVSSFEVIGTVRLGARINPAATLAAVRRIEDDELKTKLLLVVARAIQFLD